MELTNDDANRYFAIDRLQRAYADLSTRRAFQEITALVTTDA